MITVTCASCAISFGMDDELHAERKKDGSTFYCPNGHKLHFGDNDVTRLERQVYSLQRTIASLERSRDAWMATAKRYDHVARAYKGHLTRLKKRFGLWQE